MSNQNNSLVPFQTTNTVAKSLQTFQHTELTPKHIADFKLTNAASPKNIGGLAQTAATKDGLEGGAAGAGAGVLGVVAVAGLLSAPVTLPVLIGAGIIGGILGFIPKKNEPWK